MNSNKEIGEELAENSQIEFVTKEELKKRYYKKIKYLILYNSGKIISLMVALVYLTAGFVFNGPEGFMKTLLFLMLPIFLIWFPEAMGGHKGSSLGLGGSVFRGIDDLSPSSIVVFLAWIILLSPLIVSFFI